MKITPYVQWHCMLVLIMAGAGVFGKDIDTCVIRPLNFNLDHDAFRHFYEDGFTPMEAFLIDLQEGGE
jgi:hypothetical protein